jgi:uncharacterized membrane protein
MARLRMDTTVIKPVDVPRRTARRQPSVDLLRGVVMVIMALDHTRDFVNAEAMAFRPEDLAQTTPAIFFTRWITHMCAPVFAFTAGIGAYLWMERRGETAPALSRFLLTRGLWLVLLELTVVRFGFFFNIDYSLVVLTVFWMLGLSMMALAGLIHLPFRALAGVSAGLILFHNFADVVRADSLGQAGWLWNLLHQPGVVPVYGSAVIVAYPLVPWVAVMGAGFCFGRVYGLPAEQRSRLLVRLGLALTVAFVVMRLVNVYGDPSPWTSQRTQLYTLLSFLNTTKYPPSLLFLLMTLGPAIAVLGWIDRARPSEHNPLLVFGRVPLFYFVLHLPLIHAMAIGLTWLRYGAQPFLFTPPPTLGTPRDVFPVDYGWNLAVTYAVWIAAVVILYPACLWFARVKQRRHEWWVRYL